MASETGRCDKPLSISLVYVERGYCEETDVSSHNIIKQCAFVHVGPFMGCVRPQPSAESDLI